MNRPTASAARSSFAIDTDKPCPRCKTSEKDRSAVIAVIIAYGVRKGLAKEDITAPWADKNKGAIVLDSGVRAAVSDLELIGACLDHVLGICNV